MSNFKKYLEAVQHDDLDKRYLVVRVTKDYDEIWEHPMASFDTEEEAEKFVDNEYKYDPGIDQFRVKDQG